MTDEFIELKGHEGAILHIDISSKNLLASSSADGTIKVWQFDKPMQPIKTFDGFARFNEFSAAKTFSTPSFDPHGKFLAFPKSSIIQIVDTENWETKYQFANDEITGIYSVCSYSHCGKFIAAGSVTGEISVWNVNDKSKLKGEYSSEDPHALCTLAWNPKNNGEFSFCDVDGQLCSSMISKSVRKNEFLTDEAEEKDDKEKVEDDVEDDVDDIYGAIDFHDDPEDVDNENCVSLEKLKNETLKNGESDDDDDNSVKSQPASVTSVVERYTTVKPYQLQPSFQPGSTPGNLEHRFMVWNHVGQIQCHSADENSIIVEFHDVTIHKSLHLLNNLNHEMASLSTACLALATKETPCRLVVIAFVSAGNKEWSKTMPECEEIQGIAAGDNFVAVATDAGIIRFFTTMGTQREVIAISGPVVALSASENKLAVVYYASNLCNQISLMIVTLVGPSMMNRVLALPLVPNSKLLWLGFSDTGSVIAYDSSGRVISYSIKRNLWYPICDLTNHVVGASDSFFIISVSEKGQKIRATLCRGTSYPLTNPRPIVREIDYSLPLCYMETEKSKLEEALVRAVSFDIEPSEKMIVEKGLKLFASALNSELESRAYEIVELIGDKKLIEFAARLASQKGRIHVANKISKLLTDYEEKEKRQEALLNTFEQDVELFSETYEMQTPTAANKHVKETSTPLIAPKPITTQRRLNPFKKSGTTNNSTPLTTLSHLTNKSIGFNQTSTNSDDENTPKNNISMDTPRPGNFATWFVGNKADLRANYPDVSEADLMAKIGKNIYKELTQKQKQPDEESFAKAQNSSTFNKRKLNLTEDEGAVTGIAKLAKFGFSKE